jgi:hypothetical protein
MGEGLGGEEFHEKTRKQMGRDMGANLDTRDLSDGV